MNIKKQIRNVLSANGYEIRKAPSNPYTPAPIFDLAVQLLMFTAGNDLTFIQVGANDGKFGDPLRKYILKFPWRGVLIEPQPNVFKRLMENYLEQNDRVFFENIAISASASPISIFRPFLASSNKHNEVYELSIASSNPEITARQLGVNSNSLEEIKVATSTLDAMVSKYELSNLGVLQIDTEGYDWEVLKTLDLNKTRPSIIQFEHGHMKPEILDEIFQALQKAGYCIYYGGHQGNDSVACDLTFLQKNL